MKFAGIDIGSRSIELVVIDDNSKILSSHQADTSFDPLSQVNKLLGRCGYDMIIATGYGRGMLEVEYNSPTVTEIKAHARGVRYYFPEARALLDIGGQDSKAISLTETGRVKKFEMNDRCAAGTGKFLEIMAKALGYDIDEFGKAALEAEKEITISSMCTVFAESEVTSLIAKGERRQEIARGLHSSVIRRAASMIARIAADGEIVFTGGVAHNSCMVEMLKEKLGREILVPPGPQMTGALGAALILKETS